MMRGDKNHFRRWAAPLLAFVAMGCAGIVWADSFSNNVPLPVSIANGGTGATTAADARTALGVEAAALTSGHILVGNGSNIATDVAMSGDVTIGNTGAATIANLAVTNAKIAAGTIDLTTKVTGALPVANGGTGAASAGAALTALGAQAGPLTGDITTSGAAATIANLAVTGAKIAASTIDLTTKVTGTLPVGNGGVGSAAAPSSGQLPVGNAGGTAYAPQTVSGAFTLASTGVATLAAGIVTSSKIAVGAAPIIVGFGRIAATTTAVPVGAPVATYAIGGSDGSFVVSANILVTADTATTIEVEVSYTDEGGNARTLELNFSGVTGTTSKAIAATGAYEGVPLHLRVKASTTISVFTAFTVSNSMTYNIEGVIQQIQ